MVTQELITSIQQQLQRGASMEVIKNRLIQSGQQQSDIDQAFQQISQENSNKQPQQVTGMYGIPAEKIYPPGALTSGILSLIGIIFPTFGLGFAVMGIWWGFKGVKTIKKTLAVIGIIFSLVGLVLSLVQMLTHH